MDLAALYVPDAAYNSLGSRKKCLEGARKAIITKIAEWMDDGNGHPIYWLSGPARFGKLTLVQTIAERCAIDGTLVGSFFFLHDAGSHSESARFITTFTFQLTNL
jgi:predicted AAA+ superfamily ATPase